jgi:pimeloyl-ACP methyl ester carboxylesterase
MAFAKTDDGVRLHCEDVGAGTPILFVHEFAGDHRSWEPQLRYFSRRHRCIAYAARGYPPSDVPEAVERYSQARAVADILTVLDHFQIDKAHVVGLSMGGYATLHFGLDHPSRAFSLVVAGAGYGSEKHLQAEFRANAEAVAKNFRELGSRRFAEAYALGAARVQFQNKDPRGWQEFARQLAEHSAIGSANTMLGVQARRPSIYDLEERLKRLALPTLIVTGDEDDHCLQPGLFMKRMIPASGLAVIAKSGHTINLEEPDLFNRQVESFIGLVEAGRWAKRDPRANPAEIMRVAKA